MANLTPEQVAAKLKDWTSDPANQQKVKSMAIDGIKGAGSLFKKYVQEGPAGKRSLFVVYYKVFEFDLLYYYGLKDTDY